MRSVTIVATQDGHWLARDSKTGKVASGSTMEEATAELRRLLTEREAA